MGKDYLKPTTRGHRDPLESGIGQQGMIDNPPRFAQIGGLKNAGKAKSKNVMTVKRPGNSEHR